MAKTEALNKLRASSMEAIDNSKPVVVPEMQLGMCWAQGDVGIIRDEVGSCWQEAKKPDGGQIAPGNTKGSRHIISEGDMSCMTFFRINDGDELSDLGLTATEQWTLTHPEHANCTFGAGTYRVTHQQNETFERIRD